MRKNDKVNEGHPRLDLIPSYHQRELPYYPPHLGKIPSHTLLY